MYRSVSSRRYMRATFQNCIDEEAVVVLLTVRVNAARVAAARKAAEIRRPTCPDHHWQPSS